MTQQALPVVVTRDVVDQSDEVRMWREMLALRRYFPDAERERVASLLECYDPVDYVEHAVAPHDFAPALRLPGERARAAAALRTGGAQMEQAAELVLAFARATVTHRLRGLAAHGDPVALPTVWTMQSADAKLRLAALASDPAFYIPDELHVAAQEPARPTLRKAAPVIVGEAPAHAERARRMAAREHARAQAQAKPSAMPVYGKYPLSGRRFSLEIEGFLANGAPNPEQIAQVQRALEAAGLRGFKVETAFQVQDDVRGTPGGVRVLSPSLRDIDGLARIKQALTVLQEQGFCSNPTCLLTVSHQLAEHGEAVSLTQVKQLAAAWVAQEPALAAFTVDGTDDARDRRGSRIGTLLTLGGGPAVHASERRLAQQIADARTIGQLQYAANPNGDRHALCLRSVVTRGVVENRMREAEFADPQEVIEWIRLSDATVSQGLQGRVVMTLPSERATAVLEPTRAVARAEAAARDSVPAKLAAFAKGILGAMGAHATIESDAMRRPEVKHEDRPFPAYTTEWPVRTMSAC